jgi:acetylornithine deacetylase/succinyl-diaminopimelate desuccinylase-like protein
LDFVEACRKLISFDSTPSQSLVPMMRWLGDYSRSKGLYFEIQEEASGDIPQANIIVRPVKQRPALELMFQTHLDTPDPGPFGLWGANDHNPFDAHIIDGKIFGIGAADTKLDFLCKLEAMSHFSDQKLRLPPVAVGTFGEETGMTGALKLIRKNKINTKMAMIGEPSNLQLITSGKGIASVEIRIPFDAAENKYRQEHNLRESTSTQSRIFNGRAAHSSAPHLGESAIKKMFEYLLNLPDNITVMEIDGGVNFNTVPANAFLEIDLVGGYKLSMGKKVTKIYRALMELEDNFLQYQDADFYPSHPTLNIGVIRTYEDHVCISGTCRIPPIVSNETYEKWMEKLDESCKAVESELRVTDYKRPFKTEIQSVFVKGCLDELKQMDLPHQPVTQPSTNEASLFSRIGIECVSFGPGIREGNIHTPKEHVAIKDLNKATDFYRRIIQRFCV